MFDITRGYSILPLDFHTFFPRPITSLSRLLVGVGGGRQLRHTHHAAAIGVLGGWGKNRVIAGGFCLRWYPSGNLTWLMVINSGLMAINGGY